MGFINYVCKKNNIKLLPLRAVGLKDKIKGGGFVVTPEAAKNLVLYDDTVNQVEKTILYCMKSVIFFWGI